MLGVVDPVGLGLVSSLARPDANLTGNTYGAPNMASKQLELLRDVAGGISRVAFLWNPESPGNRGNARDHQAAAPDLGLELLDVPVRTPAEISTVLDNIRMMKPQAMRVLSDPVFNDYKPQWLGFARSERLPAMYQQLDWVREGGLMAYVADNVELARRGAYYVDRLLRGAKPSELPIEQPTSFEFYMNAATAESLDITIQPEIAVQVTKWF